LYFTIYRSLILTDASNIQQTSCRDKTTGPHGLEHERKKKERKERDARSPRVVGRGTDRRRGEESSIIYGDRARA
jgi:hypothetical protein